MDDVGEVRYVDERRLSDGHLKPLKASQVQHTCIWEIIAGPRICRYTVRFLSPKFEKLLKTRFFLRKGDYCV